MSHSVNLTQGKEALFLHDVQVAVDEVRESIESLETATAYTPTAGLFATSDPTSIEEALNRIAALLKTLNSNTPIP